MGSGGLQYTHKLAHTENTFPNRAHLKYSYIYRIIYLKYVFTGFLYGTAETHSCEGVCRLIVVQRMLMDLLYCV